MTSSRHPGIATLLGVMMIASCGGGARAPSPDSTAARLAQAPGAKAGAVEDSFDVAVALLIERALDPTTRLQALWGLEALGCRAVPSIIHRLDDRRPLSGGGISLRNRSPGAFEGMRYYSPGHMVDALAAILNQITGQDFGPIYNGASDSARAVTVRGWRDYLQRLGARGVCGGGG